MPTTITVFVAPYKKLHGWGYTKRHEKDGLSQLVRIFESYPTPLYLDHAHKGRLLMINQEIGEDKMHQLIDAFVSETKIEKKIEVPKSSIDTMGLLPLKEIHDPILKKNINSLWTLDVSYNPALSIKDIMAKKMVEDALRNNKIHIGKTVVVEATGSGNTGAGIALIDAYYGLSTILIVPDKVNGEKINRLRMFGAHVIVAPTKVAPENPRSYYSIRDYLGKKRNIWVSQQYNNPSNTKAHKQVTGALIWKQTEGKVTTVIVPTGTGGTASGIGRYLKSKNSKIKIIGVDMVGSILYLLKQGRAIQEVQKYAFAYDLQGFGEDIYPKNLDLSIIDEYIRISDITGLNMTRYLPALGFFQGQSSGASYAALVEAISRKIVTKDDNVVVIFPDLGIPYRKDVFNDKWMKEKKFFINY